MKKNPQGKRWHRLDNTGKIFPMIANENLSNVFRISVTLKEEIDPGLLDRALEEVLPRFGGFKVKLKRGFFWYYFEENKRQPFVEQESSWPCRYIDPKSNQLYLFRVSYYGARINLEVFHAVTDGMGAVNFLKELTAGYLELKRGGRSRDVGPGEGESAQTEDSYLKHYRKMRTRRYSSRPALRLTGRYIPFGGQSVVHGYADTGELKAVSRKMGVSITKYLTACLIWSISRVYQEEGQEGRHIGVNLPINLRAFFGSNTASNFFAVTAIDHEPGQGRDEFEEILASVCRQMDEKIVKEKLEETISYNVSNEKKWYVRILPLFVKWLALGFIFRRNDRAHTITLSNIGLISMDREYQEEIEGFCMLIGVSERQPAKCGVCSFGDRTVITFTKVFQDSRLEECFFGRLRSDGIPVELESNGVIMPESDKGNYPVIQHGESIWKKLVLVCYGVLAVVALFLGLVNIATYDGLWWSGIAIPGIAYVGLTLRYSILRHANLGKSLLIQTVGMQILLVMIDRVLGFEGWSVNYAVPGTILFADAAVVLLIVVNRLNWQSYFMYQIAITVFSFIPLILWAAGLVTHPAMAIITVILNYPVIQHGESIWKKLVLVCYGVLAVVALFLGLVNIATYDGLWWSGIAIPGIAYVGLTLRYSILRHANLGKSLLIQTVGMQILLVMIDRVLGFEGWSVNYAVPGTILFADAAVVLLIVVNRLNWQSYFMYQIAITVFSFIPLILWAAGLVTHPAMAIITVILTVGILALTIFLGDRRFKNELIRRFHL